MPISPGDKLGPYEILAPIGAGGMGEVYKARDTRLDRTVAVRVLPEHVAQRDDLRGRFEREARAMADAYNEVEIKERAATVFQHIFYAYPTVPSPL
jgi:serine/threonine protein kinase